MNSVSAKKYLTQEGYRKAENELSYLKNERRISIAEKIKAAKELGDLSENAEYAEAKEEQSFVESRIIELIHLLKHAEIVSDADVLHSVVAVGCQVTVSDEAGQKTYFIVGYNEADPAKGKISNEAPLAQALLGKKKGEIVNFQTPNGVRRLSIVDLQYKNYAA